MSGESEVEKTSVGRLFIPSLVMSFFATALSIGILRLLVTDIAREFNIPVGVAAQLATLNTLGEFAIAFLIGFLAIRFKHKSLLLGGVLLVAISAIGSFLSPNLGFLLFFFALEGIGSVIVGVMGTTLIGNSLPLNEKSKALSYVFVATAVTAIIGFLAMGSVAEATGWRSVFLFFTLPVAVFAIGLAFLGIPSRAHQETPYSGIKSYKSAFKQVFTNRSAAFCLLGVFFISAGGIGLYTTTYFREYFEMSISQVSYFGAIITLTTVVAYLVGGRLVNKVGRKNLTVASALGAGVSSMLVFLMPNLWLAISVDVAHVFIAYVGAVALTSYILEQVPKSRSTMMSMRSIVNYLADVVFLAAGGALLILFSFNLALSYQILGVVLGSIGIVASAIFHFLTKDPTQP